MAESRLCNRLRNTILDHQNALQPARTKVHRLNAEINRLEKLIPDLESQIRFASVEATIMGAARRLKPKRGATIAVLGKTEAAIRLSRLESELRNAKPDLDRAKSELKEVEKMVDLYVGRIPATRIEMEREGCELIP
jgi:predicted  nucleic acid-binding Zn-ribbon protein